MKSLPGLEIPVPFSAIPYPGALLEKCTGVQGSGKCTGVRGSNPGALFPPRTPVHFCLFPFLTRYPRPPVHFHMVPCTPGALFDRIPTPYALLESAPGSKGPRTLLQSRPRMHFPEKQKRAHNPGALSGRGPRPADPGALSKMTREPAHNPGALFIRIPTPHALFKMPRPNLEPRCTFPKETQFCLRRIRLRF